MLNDIFRTYKKIIIFVLILLSAVFFWFYGCHRQKSGGEQAKTWEKITLSDAGGIGYHFESPELSGQVIFGTRGYIARDRRAPVIMEISCKEESFAGTLRITLPGVDGKGVSYQSAVNCKKGVISRVVMEVPSLGNASWFSFELLDSFGGVRFSEEIISREKAKQDDSEIEEIYVGVLSDQYKKLDYLDGQTIETGEGEACLRLIPFLQQDMPTDVRELNCLSVLLIDHFSLDSLSQIQQECLLFWVEKEGGSLLLAPEDGTESLLKEKAGLVPGRRYEQLYSFRTDISYTGNVRLHVSDWGLSDQWKPCSLSEPVSTFLREYGEGQIMVTTYSLLDDTFLRWTGRDEVIRMLFQECVPEKSTGRQGGDTSLWYIKKALYAFMNARHPNTFNYALYFIAYLGVLGFFAYHLLRKMKKREYIWIVVPLVSLLFTFSLLFRSGGGGQEKGREFAALRLYDFARGQDDYYFLYQNNEGEAGNVDLASHIKEAEPLDYSYLEEGIDPASLQTISQDYTINNAKNGFDIAFEETVPGNSYILKCSAEPEESGEMQCFRLDMRGSDTCFEGSVTNLSSWNFKTVVLIRGHQYVLIDGMDVGETTRVRKKEVEFWTGYKGETLLFGNKEETTALGNMTEYLQQKYILENEQQNEILAIGITGDNDFPLFSGEDALGRHLTVAVERCAVPQPDNEECIVNINSASLEGDRGEALRFDILEKNETKATYSFDTGKVVWKMFRNRDGFEGRIYAYNYETGEMDELFTKEDMVMNCGQLEPYVSDMNKMIFTFCLPGGTDYGGAPVLSVVLKEL